jgi:hypothetical protein
VAALDAFPAPDAAPPDATAVDHAAIGLTRAADFGIAQAHRYAVLAPNGRFPHHSRHTAQGHPCWFHTSRIAVSIGLPSCTFRVSWHTWQVGYRLTFPKQKGQPCRSTSDGSAGRRPIYCTRIFFASAGTSVNVNLTVTPALQIAKSAVQACTATLCPPGVIAGIVQL